jgi:hypothetical protein
MRSSLCAPVSEPRRRSVHFDASPSTIIASAAAHDVPEEVVAAHSRHYERRKSAPASALLGVGDASLAQLDPDLRKSLSKLCCTTLEDPDEDLDVINVKLLGRDELEILRLKQIKEGELRSVGLRRQFTRSAFEEERRRGKSQSSSS